MKRQNYQDRSDRQIVELTGGNVQFDLMAGSFFRVVMTADSEVTFINPAPGTSKFYLLAQQTMGGGHELSFGDAAIDFGGIITTGQSEHILGKATRPAAASRSR